MGKPISNPGGSVESTGLALSFTDGPGVGIDFDTVNVLPRVFAKAAAPGGSMGLRLMTVNAGVPLPVIDLSAVGIINLIKGQLQFPATQNPSGNGNTLDDYEEGTWSPILGADTTTTGQTYSLQTGNYIKIGRLVYASFDILLSNKGTLVGGVWITNYPFTTTSEGVTAVNYWANLATPIISFSSIPNTGASSYLYKITAATANAAGVLTGPTDLNNTSRVAGMSIYQTFN